MTNIDDLESLVMILRRTCAGRVLEKQKKGTEKFQIYTSGTLTSIDRIADRKTTLILQIRQFTLLLPNDTGFHIQDRILHCHYIHGHILYIS